MAKTAGSIPRCYRVPQIARRFLQAHDAARGPPGSLRPHYGDHDFDSTDAAVPSQRRRGRPPRRRAGDRTGSLRGGLGLYACGRQLPTGLAPCWRILRTFVCNCRTGPAPSYYSRRRSSLLTSTTTRGWSTTMLAEAARLFGAADAFLKSLGVKFEPTERRLNATWRRRAELGAALHDPVFADGAQWKQGAGDMSPDSPGHARMRRWSSLNRLLAEGAGFEPAIPF
jgi:hypothetical protein